MYIGEAAVSVSFLVEHVGLVFMFRTGKVGEEELRSGVSSTLGHARSVASKRLNWFLTKDCSRFTTLFGIVKLCLFSGVARVVPITVTRYAKQRLLETLFFCASGPCPREEAYVVRTAASLRMTDALQATVLTCKKCVFKASVCCHSKCHFAKSSEELVSSTCLAVRAGCSQVDGVRTELD